MVRAGIVAEHEPGDRQRGRRLGRQRDVDRGEQLPLAVLRSRTCCEDVADDEVLAEHAFPSRTSRPSAPPCRRARAPPDRGSRCCPRMPFGNGCTLSTASVLSWMRPNSSMMIASSARMRCQTSALPGISASMSSCVRPTSLRLHFGVRFGEGRATAARTMRSDERPDLAHRCVHQVLLMRSAMPRRCTPHRRCGRVPAVTDAMQRNARRAGSTVRLDTDPRERRCCAFGGELDERCDIKSATRAGSASGTRRWSSSAASSAPASS